MEVKQELTKAYWEQMRTNELKRLLAGLDYQQKQPYAHTIDPELKTVANIIRSVVEGRS